MEGAGAAIQHSRISPSLRGHIRETDVAPARSSGQGLVIAMERRIYGATEFGCVGKTVSVCFQSEEDGSRTEGDGIGMNMIIADNDLADGCPYGG